MRPGIFSTGLWRRRVGSGLRFYRYYEFCEYFRHGSWHFFERYFCWRLLIEWHIN